MKLQVHERLALLDMLKDRKDNFAGLTSLRKAREILSFDDKEQELFKLKIVEGHWEYDRAADMTNVQDVPLDEYVITIIREWLADLNTKRQMTDIHMSLYEKFILAYNNVGP